MANGIVATNLNMQVGEKKLLDNVSFTVPSGSITVFIGASGAGKTTTIKSVMNLYMLNSGDIKVCDLDYKDSGLHYKLGYVPEKENFPKMSAWNFLFQMSEFYDIEREQISKRIQHYADVLNIGDKLNISLPAMSSGQRKRVMIIQSLINDPDVLVMDEPTENLDPDNREVFYKIMEELKKEGKTIFVSTHNLAEFEAYATYCVIIAEGKIQHEGPVTKKEGLRKIYDKYRPKLAIEMSGKILYKD